MILKMAFKNIFRHKKRTILTLITMIFGIFFSNIGDGINQGLQYQSIENIVRNDSALYKIYGIGFHKDKSTNNPLNFLIKNDKNIIKIIKNKNISPQLVFHGSISTTSDELNIEFLGIIPEKENEVFKRSKKIIEGDFLESGNLVIGSEIAKLLKIKLGDTVTIIGRTVNKSINAYDLRVTGIIRTENPLINIKFAFLNLNFAKEFTGSKYINTVAVMNKITEKEILKIKAQNAEIISYESDVEDIMTIIKIRKKAFFIINSVILMMAGISIVNTMLMSMLERKKEIGIMMANGMNKFEILSLFIYEGVIIGGIGSFFGSILGALFNIYFKINGIPLPIETSNLGIEIPISEKLYTYFDPYICLNYFLIGIFIAVVSTVYPAWKASKLNPSEAIRR